MKWGRSLAEKSDSLPDWLVDRCISYKKWKKRIKRASEERAESIRDSIMVDCRRVDRAFRIAYREAFEPAVVFCAISRADVASPDQIRLFADLNCTTLYKICKRIDKRLSPTPSFASWLKELRSTLAIQFLGGYRRSSLCIEMPAECPICLEDADRIAIARCGHYVCELCLSEIYDLKGRRGTLENLIQTREDLRPSRCSQCRAPNPFREVCLWPAPSKNHIKIFGLLEL